MKVYRLTKRKYAKVLDGKGAANSSNRWNSKGVEIIYTAESRALAMAEVAVHLTIASLPKKMGMIEIDVPDSIKVKKLDTKILKGDWNCHPHTKKTQLLGDEFIHSGSACVYKVPSAVVKGDFNYLINPNHPDMSQIKITEITDFPFDKRIFKD